MSSLLYPRHERRAEKVRKELRAKGIDLFILTNQQKISYTAGTWFSDWNGGTCVLLWSKEDPTLVATFSEKNRLWLEGYIRDIEYWNPPFHGLKPITPAEKCVEAIRKRGLEKGTIAVEQPSIPWELYSKLQKALPKATFVNGEDLINEVMRVKDDEELSLMKRACAMADAALQAVIENARIGMTETQLAGIAEKPMRDLGCAYFYNPTQMNFDNRILCDHIVSENILQRGDKIQCDFHPVWKEYRGDYCRTLSLGKPTKEYEKMTDTVTKLAHEWIKSIVPGASTNKMAQKFTAGIKNAGYPDPSPVWLGHGIGTGHLPPLICAGLDWKLKENEVIAICAYVHNPGQYSYVEEICTLVTKGGGIPLNKHPLGLIVIDR